MIIYLLRQITLHCKKNGKNGHYGHYGYCRKIKSIFQNAIIILTTYAKAVLSFMSESIAAVGAYLATRFSPVFNFITVRVIFPIQQLFLTIKNKIQSYWFPIQRYCD